MRFSVILFTACLMSQAILPADICSAQEETPEIEMRLANGVPVEGTFKSATPEGLTVQSAKGTKVLPWKYLSAGTRWRYERPMLAELEAKRIKAEKVAKAKAEAAAKAAAAKAAAAANSNKPPATAATINQPTITAPTPAVVVSNKPSLPAAK